ncbi:MAG TPA: tetratricopeptide repeat protein, partial [Caulobacteraceae bacterium]|nr:tetratricopeptide repeat protein [Caulobacteraceae bacterium]
DRHDEAVALLDRMIAGGSADWRLHYMRAISLDRLDRWPEAEADLQKALEMAPAEAEILNYLGYAWIDRGVKVKEGMALVERAVASEPRSGAMQDSLAWAHYRLGDYAKAVELLELAVGLTPADPEINDHLGDAYWMVGRKDEARFQWNRVLTLDPDAEQKASAERKLKDGLASPARDVAP